jgi:aspartate aminotransferase-like enzyme
MINHRGPEYADMLDRMTANLRTVFMTTNDAYFITASGTGAMETAIVNTISPGDKVLSISVGVFGDRFREIAEVYGADVTPLDFDLGEAADPDKVRAALREIDDCKAVIFTHNESSTGVANPLEQLCAVIHEESDALILVDAVSSAGGMAISVDAWGIDVVATASQKSWVAPPGIAMVTFSKKAWAAHERSTTPKYYYDVQQYEDYLKIGQPPFTPCLPAMFAVEKSLEEMVAEGVESVFARHHEIASHTRDGARSLGLELVPEEQYASDTVTAIRLPAEIDGKEFLARVRRDFDVILGGGQKSLTGKIFRIGHMGWVETAHVDEALEAAGRTLRAMQG